MGERYAEVTQHGTVGEVALLPTYGQLLREVREQRPRDAEVALRVLEVYWVDLVRHGRTPHLARDGLLPEVLHTDVLPNVLTQVDEYRRDADVLVHHRRNSIVVLDLSRRMRTL